MTTWHPTIIAYEVTGAKRYNLTQNGGTFSTTVWIPTAGDVDEFMSYLIIDRPAITFDGGGDQEFVMRPVSANSRIVDACYTTDGDGQIINPNSGYLVDINYSNSVQSQETIFGQTVLVTERIIQQTEFLKLDYNQFYWDVAAGPGATAGTGICGGYKPLRSPDETPGIAFKSFKVDMTIERLNIDGKDTGTADKSISELLEFMSGTVNNDAATFYTWSGPWAAETIMVQVNNLERTVERYGAPPGEAGTAPAYWWWWTVSLTFNVRPQGWNKFWRIDETGTNGYEWTRLRAKGAQSCDYFYPYPLESYVNQLLLAGIIL